MGAAAATEYAIVEMGRDKEVRLVAVLRFRQRWVLIGSIQLDDYGSASSAK